MNITLANPAMRLCTTHIMAKKMLPLTLLLLSIKESPSSPKLNERDRTGLGFQLSHLLPKAWSSIPK